MLTTSRSRLLRYFCLLARFACCSLLLASLAFAAPESDPWLIVPGGASGAITTSTTRRDLVDRYQAANVVDEDVSLGEGETEPGTVIFPSDPKRKLEILWKDPDSKLSPKLLIVSGGASLWKTVHAISLGTSLKDLESINRRPFLLYGFGWDYGGTVSSWKGGVLAGEFKAGGHLILRLNYWEQKTVTRREENQVQGDRPFSSGHLVMQKLNPTVFQIEWRFQ